MKSVFYNSSLDEAFLADSSLSLTKPKEIKDLGDGLFALLDGDKAIGFNLKHPKEHGLELSDGLNPVLKGDNKATLEKLLLSKGYAGLGYGESSHFLVAKITKEEEHPVFESSRILTLSIGGKTLSTVTRYANCHVGDKIVVKTEGYRFDGTVFEARVEKNIPIECEVCSPLELRLSEEGKKAHIEYSKEEGEDFFA